MSITIIIPVYNRADLVKATLQSVAEQTVRPLQLILVDNNSTDSTLATLQQFQAEHQASDFSITVLQEATPGAAAARNCGLRAATSEWVMFFDSDDTMAPDLVETYAKAIADNPLADIIISKASLIALDGNESTLPFFTSDAFANHLIHTIMSTIRYIARRTYFTNAGGWDESQTCWDDYELGVRLLLQMPTLVFIGDKPRVFINATEQSITGTDYSSRHKACEYALDTITRNIEASQHLQRERLLKIVDYRRVVLAALYAHEGHQELARPLYGKVIRQYVSSPVLSTLFAIAYSYISHGGRGFGRLIRLLIR